MSQTQTEKYDIAKRWDFADLILGGKDGGIHVVKHPNRHSDIAEKPEILKSLYDECVKKAYDSKATMTDNGPIGQIANCDFAIEYKDYEAQQMVRFRVNVQPSTKGVFFCMRRVNGQIPELLQQGYPQEIIDKLLSRSRRGLVLFGGEMGVGKTSAASSMVSSWLRKNGGSAITLEDPPEYNLQGYHKPVAQGDVGGFCIQRAVGVEGMDRAIPSLMRASAPEIIFLGEIRDAKVAHEAVLAASNGHLVVSTIHGKGIEGCINRILSLAAAGSEHMNIDDTAKLLSESLSMIIYQDLMRQKSTGKKILRLRHIDMTEGKYSASLKTKIRERKIELLGDEIGDPVQNPSSI